MSLINFGSNVDFLNIGTPSFGETYVGYDIDGILKQKDYLGVITIIGASNSVVSNTTPPLYGDGSFLDPIGLSMSSDFGLTNSGISLNLDYKLLVTPVIVSNWSIFMINSVTPFPNTTISGGLFGSQSSGSNILAPDGCVLSYSGSALIGNGGSSFAPPTNVIGSFTFSSIVPPATGYHTASNIITNTTYNIIISKPKTGLIVDNSQVVRASGLDSKSSSVSVTFNNIFYFGYLQIGPNGVDIDQITVDGITAPQIEGLGNYRWGSKSQSGFVVNDTIYGIGYRLVFAYLASDGDVSSILTSMAPGVNVIGGFLKRTSDLSITTISGKVLTYRVWVAKPNNSYNNVTINTIA